MCSSSRGLRPPYEGVLTGAESIAEWRREASEPDADAEERAGEPQACGAPVLTSAHLEESIAAGDGDERKDAEPRPGLGVDDVPRVADGQARGLGEQIDQGEQSKVSGQADGRYDEGDSLGLLEP